MLDRVYQNETAKDILKNIDEKREKNPYSPQWEDYLIYRVTKPFRNKEKDFERCRKEIKGNEKCLELFDEFALTKFRNLKKDRNLCAHPTNDENRALREFNQEDVRLHIRNMFELVFLKDSFFIADFIKELDKEISEYGTKYDVNVDECVQNRSIEAYFYDHYAKERDKDEKKSVIMHLLESIVKKDIYKEAKLIFRVLDRIIFENQNLSEEIFENQEFVGNLLKDISLSDGTLWEVPTAL